MSKGMIITSAGLDLLAKALTGKELKFTRGAVGDGTLPDEADPRELTGLIAEKKSLAIQSMRASSTGTCEVVFDVNNIGLETGFWLREYGLFALDPDTESEILYSYCNKGTHAGYLEGNNGIDIMNFSLTLTTVIDQAENITAIINTANNYVTISRMDSKIEALYAEDADIAGVYTYGKNSEKRFTPTKWQDFKLNLLGITDISNLRRRLEILESNYADALLELEKSSMYPDYTHYLIEDFRNPDTIDMLRVKVTDTVAGDESANVQSLSSLRLGAWYTLTDGIRSEQVQVTGMSTENGINRVRFASPVSETYALSTAVLLRTDASVSGSGATSSASRQKHEWHPSSEWQGISANSAYTASAIFDSASWQCNGRMTVTAGGTLTLRLEEE